MEIELQRLADLMTSLGFTDAVPIIAICHGEPIAGVKGKWDGVPLESTFYVEPGKVLRCLGLLETIIRSHVRKSKCPIHGPRRRATDVN